MRKKYIWGSIDEIPFNLDPRKLGEYDISHLDYPEVHPNLIPYVDNSFYLNLIKQGVEPFEFEYITFINAMTHNLIEYDGKVLKTYCVENYSLSDDDDERDRIWYDTLDNEALPEEFYEFIESNKNYPGAIQNNNVPKMFHQSLGDDKSNISNDNDTSIDDEVLSYHKFSQENLDSLKKDKNTKLQILKDIFTDIDFPDYANEEWYLALAHQKSVAKLDYYWEGILPDYPNVAKTLANNHHINKKLLSDVRNFGKKLEKLKKLKRSVMLLKI